MREQRGAKRARRSAAEWRRIVKEQRRSGMPVAAFAAANGLNPHTLRWWRSHLGGRSGRPGRAGSRPDFIEIAAPLPASTEAPALEAVLPSGVIVRGHDGDQVARLVTALLRPC